jgi:hypothetical protein
LSAVVSLCLNRRRSAAQIISIRSPDGLGEEWVILELQGTVECRGVAGIGGMELGSVEFLSEVRR